MKCLYWCNDANSNNKLNGSVLPLPHPRHQSPLQQAHPTPPPPPQRPPPQHPHPRRDHSKTTPGRIWRNLTFPTSGRRSAEAAVRLGLVLVSFKILLLLVFCCSYHWDLVTQRLEYGMRMNYENNFIFIWYYKVSLLFSKCEYKQFFAKLVVNIPLGPDCRFYFFVIWCDW